MADIVQVVVGNVLRAGGSVLVVDNLDSTSETAALSAKQGSVLAGMIEDIDTGGAAPVQSVAGKTGAVTLAKSDVGLPNVDNTSDANKPVSTAQAAAIAAKVSASSLSTVAISGVYNDLSGKPTLSTVAGTGAYADLSGKPSLATVATTGSFADLNSKPTYTVLASLPGNLSGYVDGSEIVVTG